MRAGRPEEIGAEGGHRVADGAPVAVGADGPGGAQDGDVLAGRRQRAMEVPELYVADVRVFFATLR